MSDNLKLSLIDAILSNYYECCYENEACAAVLDTIFVILSFEGNAD